MTGIDSCPDCDRALDSPSDSCRAKHSEQLRRVCKALPSRYAVHCRLGGGGMADVYLARDSQLAVDVAIKVLSDRLSATVDRERFQEEAKTLAPLQHDNVVKVFDSDVKGDLLYTVMGFVDGPTLSAINDRATRQDATRPTMSVKLQILRDVAAALKYLHERGIKHRDVKPSNVIVDRVSGAALLADFGIAKSSSSSVETQTGLVLGTWRYASPERLAGEEGDELSDMYSFGVLSYELLAGRHPFPGRVTFEQWRAAHFGGHPPQLRRACPDCPKTVAAAVMQMLSRAPGDRRPPHGSYVGVFDAALRQWLPEQRRKQVRDFARTVPPPVDCAPRRVAPGGADAVSDLAAVGVAGLDEVGFRAGVRRSPFLAWILAFPADSPLRGWQQNVAIVLLLAAAAALGVALYSRQSSSAGLAPPPVTDTSIAKTPPKLPTDTPRLGSPPQLLQPPPDTSPVHTAWRAAEDTAAKVRDAAAVEQATVDSTRREDAEFSARADSSYRRYLADSTRESARRARVSVWEDSLRLDRQRGGTRGEELARRVDSEREMLTSATLQLDRSHSAADADSLNARVARGALRAAELRAAPLIEQARRLTAAAAAARARLDTARAARVRWTISRPPPR
jgi:hypothetical protein